MPSHILHINYKRIEQNFVSLALALADLYKNERGSDPPDMVKVNVYQRD